MVGLDDLRSLFQPTILWFCFKGANPSHSRSPGHLTSFHLTDRPIWPHLFNPPASRDGCTGRNSVIFSFAVSPISCPDEILAAHPLSWWLHGLRGFLVSPTRRRSCHVFPRLCHPLPPAMSSDNVGMIFSRDTGEASLVWVEGSVRASAATGLSSIVLRIIRQQGQGWESWKSSWNQAGGWARMWPRLHTAIRRTRTLAISNQNCFASWLLVMYFCKRGGCSECSLLDCVHNEGYKAMTGITPLPS